LRDSPKSERGRNGKGSGTQYFKTFIQFAKTKPNRRERGKVPEGRGGGDEKPEAIDGGEEEGEKTVSKKMIRLFQRTGKGRERKPALTSSHFLKINGGTDRVLRQKKGTKEAEKWIKNNKIPKGKFITRDQGSIRRTSQDDRGRGGGELIRGESRNYVGRNTE